MLFKDSNFFFVMDTDRSFLLSGSPFINCPSVSARRKNCTKPQFSYQPLYDYLTRLVMQNMLLLLPFFSSFDFCSAAAYRIHWFLFSISKAIDLFLQTTVQEFIDSIHWHKTQTITCTMQFWTKLGEHNFAERRFRANIIRITSVFEEDNKRFLVTDRHVAKSLLNNQHKERWPSLSFFLKTTWNKWNRRSYRNYSFSNWH